MSQQEEKEGADDDQRYSDERPSVWRWCDVVDRSHDVLEEEVLPRKSCGDVYRSRYVLLLLHLLVIHQKNRGGVLHAVTREVVEDSGGDGCCDREGRQVDELDDGRRRDEQNERRCDEIVERVSMSTFRVYRARDDGRGVRNPA